MAKEITIRVSSDYSFLGEDAQRSDLDRFAANIKRLLCTEFPDTTPRIWIGAFGRSVSCPDDDDVDARLKEITSGDEWIGLLG